MTGATITDVTNATVTIKTTGRPVQLRMESSSTHTTGSNIYGNVRNTGSTNCKAHAVWDRGGSAVNSSEFGFASGSVAACVHESNCASFSYLDTSAPAGSNTYKFRVLGDSGGVTVAVDKCVLVAYELP